MDKDTTIGRRPGGTPSEATSTRRQGGVGFNPVSQKLQAVQRRSGCPQTAGRYCRTATIWQFACTDCELMKPKFTFENRFVALAGTTS